MGEESILESLGTMISVGVRGDIEVPRTIFIGIRLGDKELQHNLTKDEAHTLVAMILDAVEGHGLYD